MRILIVPLFSHAIDVMLCTLSSYPNNGPKSLDNIGKQEEKDMMSS